MAQVKGLVGLRPVGDSIASITCPPYDVIKEGSPLERVLKQSENSLYHITLEANRSKLWLGCKQRGFYRRMRPPAFTFMNRSTGKKCAGGFLRRRK